MPGVHFSVPAAVQDVSVWLLLQEVALQVKRVALDCHAIYRCQPTDGCPQHVLLAQEEMDEGEDSTSSLPKKKWTKVKILFFLNSAKSA